MSGTDRDPDEDLIRSLLHRSDGPVVIRPLRAPVSLRRAPFVAVVAAALVAVVIAGLAGLALNARQREASARPSPSPVAASGSPLGANLGPQPGRGFVVNLGGHGIGIRTEADATPYFQVTSRTLLSYAVSPNGKLAYWQTGPDDALPHELHVYDPATRADRIVLTLTDERGGSSGFMVWSTDSGGIAFGTSDVGSAFEGQRAPARPKVATWSLLDLGSGSRRKIATISDAWVVPVSWDRQTDIATAIEYGRDGPSTPTRLFYVWNPSRTPGKTSQFVLPAAIDPYTAHADSSATYVVGVETLRCAPSTCQSVWTWPVTDPAAAIARGIAGHTLGAAAFRPGTTDLFALMGPLCCTTSPPTERPAIVELGSPGSSTLSTVYAYGPGDANFFFRSDGSGIVVNNSDLNNRRGLTVVDPANRTTILLPTDRNGVEDVIGSIGPGPLQAAGPPCASATLIGTMSVCPAEVVVGGAMTISGTNCGYPGSEAIIYFGPKSQNNPFGSTELGRFAVDSANRFSATVTVPAVLNPVQGAGGGPVGPGLYRLFSAPPGLCEIDVAVSAAGATRSAPPGSRYLARTAADVLRGMAGDPIVTGGSPGFNAQSFGAPLFVRALRPQDYDIWLVPDRRCGVVAAVFAVPVGKDGYAAGSAWSGNTSCSSVEIPQVSEAAARAVAGNEADPIASAELVWLPVAPYYGFYVSEFRPLWLLTRRSGAIIYVDADRQLITPEQVDARR